MVWWIHQGIWAAPVRSCLCPQLLLHFMCATELPLTCTWTPTPCDAPFPREGEPGRSVLNLQGLQSDMMETWVEKQHWKTDVCTLGDIFSCVGRLWRHSLASCMLLRIEDEMKGFDQSRSMVFFHYVSQRLSEVSVCGLNTGCVNMSTCLSAGEQERQCSAKSEL